MQKDEWADIHVPFSDFLPIFRAKLQRSAPAFDPSTIYSLQIMFSKFEYDGKLNPTFTPGLFQLPILSVGTYLPQPCKARVICVNAATCTSGEQPSSNEQAAILREVGVPYALLDAVRAPAEAARAPAEAVGAEARVEVRCPAHPGSSRGIIGLLLTCTRSQLCPTIVCSGGAGVHLST
jgi:Complex I intermediate-associated protein 30 (CIA30)